MLLAAVDTLLKHITFGKSIYLNSKRLKDQDKVVIMKKSIEMLSRTVCAPSLFLFSYDWHYLFKINHNKI